MANRNILDIISKARERNARWLNLSNLSLEELPPEIGQLTELRVLWLTSNKLTRLPAEIGHLRKLKRLRLEGNALAELQPEIGLLTELEELQLHKNQLPRLPREFWRLVNLERAPPKNEIECPVGEEDVYVPQMLYGLHPDTTYQMLSRKLDEVRAGVGDKHEEAMGGVRLLQRELTNHYNALQRAEEASCPYVFVMRGGAYDGDLIGLFGPTGSHGMLDSLRETVWKRKVELQLYCQQPGCWHPVGYERGKDYPATGLYQIEVGSDFLKLVGPHLTRVAKLFKFAQPLLGPWVSWAAPEKYTKQFKEDLDRMKKLADQVGPAVEDSHEAKRAGALGDGRDPREANGAMLRALKRLLEEKDKTGAWGGLARKLTKEGHYLWLCPTHAEEYQD